MQFHEFMGQVQSRARLASLDEAMRATRATLQTLCDRLGGEEPRHLLAQLPQEVANLVGPPAARAERFDSKQFFERVSEREGVQVPDAAFHARAVLDVLNLAVSPGEMQQVRQQLPPDFQRIFEAGAQGRLKPKPRARSRARRNAPPPDSEPPAAEHSPPPSGP